MLADLWGGVLLLSLAALGAWVWAGGPLPAGLVALIWPEDEGGEGPT